jgi:hypothetical protein
LVIGAQVCVIVFNWVPGGQLIGIGSGVIPNCVQLEVILLYIVPGGHKEHEVPILANPLAQEHPLLVELYLEKLPQGGSHLYFI